MFKLHAEEEGTDLLEALAGWASNTGKQRGAVLLNGQSVSPSQLRDRVAYVQCDSHLSPDLSVRQTLSLHHWLRYSGAHHSKLNTKDRVSSNCACVLLSIAIIYTHRDVTGWLSIIIITTIYYVLSDELHGYIFRPLSSHLQAIKIREIKITIAT